MKISRTALPLICLAGLSACAVDVDPPEVAACKSAVAARSTTGAAPAMTVLSNQPAIDGKRVMIREASGTTWECVTDLSGAVTYLDLGL